MPVQRLLRVIAEGVATARCHLLDADSTPVASADCDAMQRLVHLLLN